MRRAAGYVLAIVLLLALARWAVAQLFDIGVLLLAALFLSFALDPIVVWLERRHGWRRSIATGVVFLLMTLTTLAFLAMMAALLADQVRHLSARMPGRLGHIQHWLAAHGLHVDLRHLDDRLGRQVTSGAWQASLTALSSLTRVATVLFFAFYFVVDGPRLRRSICSALPPDRQVQLLAVWEKAVEKTGAYLLSRGVLAAISSVVHALAFTALGVPYGAILGLWQGIVSQALPTVGTYVGASLPVLLAVTHSVPLTLSVLAVIIVYQQIENYLLVPRIQGRAMDLHPAIALGSVLVGGQLLGLTGVLLAMPVTATVQAFWSVYGRRYELVEHELVRPGVSLVPAPTERDDAGGTNDHPPPLGAPDQGENDASYDYRP